MTSRPGYCWRLILVAILISLAWAGHALAGSIYVFDGSAAGGRNFIIGGLVGERGFTLDQFFRPFSAGGTDAYFGCGQSDSQPFPPFDRRCHPGDSISLSFSSAGPPDISGHATLDGKSYTVGGPSFEGKGFTPGTQCFLCPPVTSGLAYTLLAPSVIAPPFSAVVCDQPNSFGCSATVTAPFTLTGSFLHLDSSTGQVVRDDLVGSGIAQLTLFRRTGPDGDAFWRVERQGSQSYELQPTPEPATLLLVGTGAAGVGLARWWKRRRSRGHEHESPSVP